MKVAENFSCCIDVFCFLWIQSFPVANDSLFTECTVIVAIITSITISTRFNVKRNEIIASSKSFACKTIVNAKIHGGKKKIVENNI